MNERYGNPPILCTRCGHAFEDHSAFHDLPTAETLARFTEARFPGIDVHGIYCPHMDMIAGEDYEVDS